MGSVDVGHIRRWQPWREVVSTALDTVLTDYKPADLTAAVRAKMLAVKPSTVIALRAWGVGADGNDFTLTLSGWMDPKVEPGAGHRFFSNNVLLGAKVMAGAVVLHDPRPGFPGTSAVWREADDWVATPTYNDFNCVDIEGASTHAILLVPTLGYTHLLAEISAMTTMTRVLLMTREIVRGNSPVVFNKAYS